MSAAFRCAAASAALSEPLAGTASTVRAFLLLEVPGPWGPDALRESRLPGEVSARIARRCARAGVRPLLIRRHGRTPSRPMRCFTAYADATRPWMETATFARAEEVLGLDLAALGRGESPGLEPHPDPLFLVCTHGRHDVCCAELGRPVAAALNASHPDHTWECSHIGGDRFAGNMLVLPDGLYYGRADAQSAPRIATLHQERRLDLDHLRGRTGLAFAAQAAEWHLRRELGVTGVGDLVPARHRAHGDVTETAFDVAGSGRWCVRLRVGRGEAGPLTCKVRRPQRPPRYELLSVSREE